MTSCSKRSEYKNSVYTVKFKSYLNTPEDVIRVLNNKKYGVLSISHTKIFNLDQMSIVFFSTARWKEIEDSLNSLFNIEEIKLEK